MRQTPLLRATPQIGIRELCEAILCLLGSHIPRNRRVDASIENSLPRGVSISSMGARTPERPKLAVHDLPGSRSGFESLAAALPPKGRSSVEEPPRRIEATGRVRRFLIGTLGRRFEELPWVGSSPSGGMLGARHKRAAAAPRREVPAKSVGISSGHSSRPQWRATN